MVRSVRSVWCWTRASPISCGWTGPKTWVLGSLSPSVTAARPGSEKVRARCGLHKHGCRYVHTHTHTVTRSHTHTLSLTFTHSSDSQHQPKVTHSNHRKTICFNSKPPLQKSHQQHRGHLKLSRNGNNGPQIPSMLIC